EERKHCWNAEQPQSNRRSHHFPPGLVPTYIPEFTAFCPVQSSQMRYRMTHCSATLCRSQPCWRLLSNGAALPAIRFITGFNIRLQGRLPTHQKNKRTTPCPDARTT